MALGNITFVKGQGGLGRPLTGEDFISGLCVYTSNGTLPSGYSTSARIKSIGSVADAENLGIKNDYSDATAAKATYAISAAGAAGNTVQISCKTVDIVTTNNIQSIGLVTVNLGTYTLVTADVVSTTTAAAALAVFINSGTYSHGFSATAATGTLTIIFPKSQGTAPNGTNTIVGSTPVVVTKVGTIAGTLTQPASATTGTQSLQAVWHYHISEFFRIQPQGRLFVGFFAVNSAYDFSELTLMQTYATGKIRQFGIWLDGGQCHAFTTGDLTAIHAEIVNNLDANHQPCSALYAADLSTTSDLTTLTDLNTLTAYKASAVISQDGANHGAFLFSTFGYSITTLGAALGAVSLASVSDSIEWVAKFNISNGTECDTPAFGNGQLLSALSQSTLQTLDGLRYIFLIKYVGQAGSYFNNSYTAVASTSDYAKIEGNRTIDKAIRGVYAGLLPALGSPIVLNSDGTLTDTSVAYFTSLAEVNLTQMKRDAELSSFKVTIDPTQNVLSTGLLIVAVQLLPVGVANNIQVNIGFVTSIS